MKTLPAPTSPADPIDCQAYRCRLAAGVCLRRQLEHVRKGNHPPKPRQEFCGSGKCQQGVEVWRQLPGEAQALLDQQRAQHGAAYRPHPGPGVIQLRQPQPPQTATAQHQHHQAADEPSLEELELLTQSTYAQARLPWASTAPVDFWGTVCDADLDTPADILAAQMADEPPRPPVFTEAQRSHIATLIGRLLAAAELLASVQRDRAPEVASNHG